MKHFDDVNIICIKHKVRQWVLSVLKIQRVFCLSTLVDKINWFITRLKFKMFSNHEYVITIKILKKHNNDLIIMFLLDKIQFVL